MGGKESKEAESTQPSSSSSPSTSTPSGRVPVVVNVYRPRPGQGDSGLPSIGLGVYHSGVEIFDTEYSYAEGPSALSGISSSRPKIQPSDSPWEFQESISVGFSPCRREDVRPLINEMGNEWPSNQYDITSKNCNHFSEALCNRLGVSFPSWVNRAAKVANPIRSTLGMKGNPKGATAMNSDVADILPVTEFHREALKLEKVQNFEVFTEGWVEEAKVAALNQMEKHSIVDVITKSNKLKYRHFIESNVDPQLLIFFPFTRSLRMVGLQLQLSSLLDDFKCHPKKIKFYINDLNIDFTDCNGGNAKVVHEVTLENIEDMREDSKGSLLDTTKNPQTKTEKKENLISIHIPLKPNKFAMVTSLGIFVEDNRGGNTTKIWGFELFGRPSEAK